MIAHQPSDGWRAITTDPTWPSLTMKEFLNGDDWVWNGHLELLKGMTETDLIFMGWLLWNNERTTKCSILDKYKS